ncbi:MAG TPA: LysE family translocator [Telluria sp.]
MDLVLAVSFWSFNLLLSVTPGPAVINVMGAAANAGQWRAQASIFGILVGNLIYIALACLGMGALFAAVPGSLVVLRWLGAAYLGWLGLQSLRAWRRAGEGPDASVQAPPSGRRLFSAALTLQLSNPKSILFFGAMLPQFVSSGGWPPLAQMALLGAVAVLLEYPVLCAYAWLASRRSVRRNHGALQFAAGSLLLVCAFRMVVA